MRGLSGLSPRGLSPVALSPVARAGVGEVAGAAPSAPPVQPVATASSSPAAAQAVPRSRIRSSVTLPGTGRKPARAVSARPRPSCPSGGDPGGVRGVLPVPGQSRQNTVYSVDGGYQGTGLLIPHRKQRGQAHLSPQQVAENAVHRWARAQVEHALSRLKSWKILRDWRRSKATAFTTPCSASPACTTSHGPVERF